jgi:hypothetical protein
MEGAVTDVYECLDIVIVDVKGFRTDGGNLAIFTHKPKTMLHSFALPCMEPDGGNELCFLSHPMFDRRVQCDSYGHVKMDMNWQGWEVWRFIRSENETFVITSWTHSSKVLCSNPQGSVYTTENKEGGLERWKITSHPQTKGLSIQSVAHGRYLAFDGKKLHTAKSSTDDNGGKTAWFLEPGHRHHFFISSLKHEKRLWSGKNYVGNLFIHENLKAWEKWAIEPIQNAAGSFTIRSVNHRHYLGTDDNGNLRVVDHCNDEWVIVSSPHHDGVFLQSKKHSSRLACPSLGRVYLAKGGDEETWTLEPIMPDTISGGKIWSLLAIGVATVGFAVAAPFAVMGIVGAMGFGSEGIVAGSMAAGMMSAEAIASGGAIAAGGTVATLQSIGAAGLGEAGLTAAVGAGATLGGVASAVVVRASSAHVLDSSTTPIVENVVKIENPPLCSWRQWGSTEV